MTGTPMSWARPSRPDEITWWENTAGDGSAWTEQTIDGAFDGATAVYATDVDGDGDTDVLGAAHLADDITWWENQTIHRSAVHPTEHPVGGPFASARSVYATDVGRRRRIPTYSVLLRGLPTTSPGGKTPPAMVRPGASTPSTDRSTVLTRSTRPTVDGDGDTDVLGAAATADDITWWENTAGDGSAWTKHTIDGAFDGAIRVYAADVDGDGDTRRARCGSAWSNATSPGGRTPPATGQPGPNTPSTGPSTPPPRSTPADVDGDGDTDVLGAAAGADDITWWENTAGDGSAWTDAHHRQGRSDGAVSVFAVDVDDDGDTDVLGRSSVIANDITWWENTAGDGSAWTEAHHRRGLRRCCLGLCRGCGR